MKTTHDIAQWVASVLQNWLNDASDENLLASFNPQLAAIERERNLQITDVIESPCTDNSELGDTIDGLASDCDLHIDEHATYFALIDSKNQIIANYFAVIDSNSVIWLIQVIGAKYELVSFRSLW